jgi:hypothetical protein
MPDRRLWLTAFVSLVVLAIAGVACAGSPPARTPTTKPPSKLQLPSLLYSPASGGLVVGIDPETGQLGPATALQRLQLLGPEAAMLSRSTVGLVEAPVPGGGVMIDLQGRFQDLSYVRRGPDGRLVFGCTDDFATLRQAFGTPVRQAPKQALEDR